MSPEPRKVKKPKTVEQKAEVALKEAGEEVEKAARVVKKEVKKAEKAIEGSRRTKAAPAKPAGRTPRAMVSARHETGTISREGRGFSWGELSKAGIAPGLAASWGLRVDRRRRSVMEENVGSLKGWRSHPSAASAVKKETKAAESRLEDAVKGAEVDVEVIEEEAAKAEKAIKKEAKRAEKAVKEKVEKKPRPKKKSSS